MTRYLIDIRLMGSVNHQIRTLSNHLQEKFNLGDTLVVPHITLAGPFSTRNETRLFEDFTGICANQKEIPRYEVEGYGFFGDSKAVFVTITPCENLKQFRWQLSRAISPYCSLRDYDLDSADTFRFHATLAMKLDLLTFQRIRGISGTRNRSYTGTTRSRQHCSGIPGSSANMILSRAGC
jgi:2'-5' RNA ligase